MDGKVASGNMFAFLFLFPTQFHLCKLPSFPKNTILFSFDRFRIKVCFDVMRNCWSPRMPLAVKIRTEFSQATNVDSKEKQSGHIDSLGLKKKK